MVFCGIFTHLHPIAFDFVHPIVDGEVRDAGKGVGECLGVSKDLPDLIVLHSL